MAIKFSELIPLSVVDGTIIVPVVDVTGTPTSKKSTVSDLKTFILQGNADTATKFAAPVNINGVAFDGSANIEVETTDNVYYVSPDGSDTNSGKSWGLAFATIQYACTQAVGPATIRVAAGTYTEQLPIMVPSFVSIIGDSIRTTIVQPAAGDEESTMWMLGDGALLNKMHFIGLTGFEAYLLDDKDIENSTVGGVYVAFDPAIPITVKSPYVIECTAKSSGAIGAIVDGSVHATGIKSMVFHGYTIISDLGVGYWVKDTGKAEIVSCFTYYCHIGYAATGGGKIRALNGNNSYGTYGSLSSGYNVDEDTLTGNLYGNTLFYTPASLTGGDFDKGDTITGATSGATGIVNNFQPTADKIYYTLTSVTPFQNNEIVTSSGGASVTLTSNALHGQNEFVLVIDGLAEEPKPGSSIEFVTGDPTSYVIQNVAEFDPITGFVVLVLAGEKAIESSDNDAIIIRNDYSNIRLTGHDFLNIGTGGVTTTNYPDKPIVAPSQGNEVIELFPARVFYVSTDQDGNFRVGEYFRVDQATGRATLNASAFDLSGLTSLRLGSIGAQVGEVVNEFSSDSTLSGNSNAALPTEAAVRQYFTKVGTNLAPNVDNILTLGTPSNRWNHVYVGPGSITIGTLTITDDAGALSVTSSSTSNPAPVALDSIKNGTSNVSVALNSDITLTANGINAITVSDTLTTILGDLTINGGIIVNGQNYTIESTNYSISDSILDLHNPLGGGPLINDDGRDIGLKIHYFKSSDKFAFLGWANDTGYLEYYSDGTELNGVFSGTYGTIKTGGLLITGNAALNGGISVDTTAFTVADTTGNVYTAGTLEADSAVTFNSTLDVTGETTLNSSLEVVTSVTVGTTLGVTGATTLSSTLGVTDAITGQSTVSATQYTSTIATGTPPLIVTSTTKVGNLNADLLDGYDSDIHNTASTVVVRDSNKKISTSGVIFSGSTSGTTTLQSLATATGTLTLPAATDTLVGRDTSDTLTNKTLTNPVINGFTGDTSVINVGAGQLYKTVDGKIGVGTSSPSATLHIEATDAVIIPIGTSSERPTGENGMLRYNSELSSFEGYTSAGWGSIGGSVTVSDIPPNSPVAGRLWWNSELGRMFVYYSDGTSSQWVDASPNQAGLISVPVRQQFTATASQTIFTITGGYTPGCVDVFLNGVKLVNGVDVTVSSGTDVVLAVGATVGSLIDVVGLNSASLASVLPIGGGSLTGDLSLVNLNYTGTLTGSTNTLNIGSGQIYKDESGNIGIGTSSPTSLLHVSSASASAIATVQSTTYAVFRSKNSSRSVDYASDGTGGYIDIAGAPFRWYNVSSEYMRLNALGNLGIGTTAPSKKLDVAGSVGYDSYVTRNSFYVGLNGITDTQQWIKLGRISGAATYGGISITIRIHGGYGFNADPNQAGYDEIVIRGSNGSSSAGRNLGGRYYRIGTGNAILSGAKLKSVNSVSFDSDYDLYIYTHGGLCINHSIEVVTDVSGLFTWSIAGAQTDPGTQSSTVCVLTNEYGVSAATVSIPGGQLKFPAVQISSSDANTLDDYEEGTWTPRLSGTSGGSYTMGGINAGRYTKIGNIVTVTCTVNWTSVTTGYTGNLIIADLPFPCGGGVRSAGALCAVAYGLSFTSGYNAWHIVIDPGNTNFYIIQSSSSGAGYSHSPTVSSSGVIYAISLTYTTN